MNHFGLSVSPLAKDEFALQLEKKSSHCRSCCTYKVDLDLNVHGQPKPVDGFRKHVKNFVLC